MKIITDVEFENIIYSKEYSISNCKIEFDKIQKNKDDFKRNHPYYRF